MDEAFSALDPLIRTEMQDELVKLQTENRRTVVFISHDLDEAMRIAATAVTREDLICVTGSFYLVGAVKQLSQFSRR